MTAAALGLSIKSLSLSFGGLQVLHDITLSLGPGEVLGLIGPNGAGKSALFNCICGLYSPQPGSQINFLGNSLTGLPPHQRAGLGITRTFQHIHLIDSMTVLENVMIGAASHFKGGVLGRYLRPYRSVLEEKAISARAMASLECCGIAEFANQSILSLPLGIRRRIDLARALVCSPKLLLLDEPASGLASGERALVRDLVSIAQRDTGVAVIWVEHDLELVISGATRVAVLHHGRILTDGRPRDSEAERKRLLDAYMTGNIGGLAKGGKSVARGR